MEPISTVATASSLLSNTLNALKAVRERAQSSKDRDLKEDISTLYDSVLALKEAVMLVTDENRELKTENKDLKRRIAELEQPAEKPLPELRQVGAVNYYFVGEVGPYCQKCYDSGGKLTMLTPVEDWSGGKRRSCLLCGKFFHEQPMDSGPAFATAYDGPDSWMR